MKLALAAQKKQSLKDDICFCLLLLCVCYLDDTDGLPGQVEAGVEQEGEDKGKRSVPAHTTHKGAVLSTRHCQNFIYKEFRQDDVATVDKLHVCPSREIWVKVVI